MPKTITEEGIQHHLITLRVNAERLAAFVAGNPPDRLQVAPAADAWSPARILAHLRGCAEVWGYSIYAMLTLDMPELAAIHPRAWNKALAYPQLSYAENFRAFEAQRVSLLWTLERLSFEDWGRSCRFSGKVNIHTIFSQTERMALHEAQHCDQIEAMLPSP